jgi:hypothetical protein
MKKRKKKKTLPGSARIYYIAKRTSYKVYNRSDPEQTTELPGVWRASP